MKFHREGIPTLLITIMLILMLFGFIGIMYPNKIVINIFLAISAFVLITVLQFFRHPKRVTPINSNHIISPADGKVVVIEEVEETEYFKHKMIQISVFMSPINVHVNRSPIKGIVEYVKYHAGLYLVAWHPKSSTENERTTIVVKHENGKSILMRQIAGALARRIVYYCKQGDQMDQGEEFGFIKFGSRVDVFVPIDCKINVELNQKVKGGISTLASFK